MIRSEWLIISWSKCAKNRESKVSKYIHVDLNKMILSSTYVCKKAVCHQSVVIWQRETFMSLMPSNTAVIMEGWTGLTVKPSSVIFSWFRYINVSEYTAVCHCNYTATNFQVCLRYFILWFSYYSVILF